MKPVVRLSSVLLIGAVAIAISRPVAAGSLGTIIGQKIIDTCQQLLSLTGYGDITSPVSPDTITILRLKKIEAVPKDDPQFQAAILDRRDQKLDQDANKDSALLLELLRSSFGFEPQFLTAGRAVPFADGIGFQLNNYSIVPGNRPTYDLAVFVSAEKARFVLTLNDEQERLFAYKHDLISPKKGLLLRFVTRSKVKVELKSGLDRRDILEAHEEHRYVHQIIISREHLTAFVHELNSFIDKGGLDFGRRWEPLTSQQHLEQAKRLLNLRYGETGLVSDAVNLLGIVPAAEAVDQIFSVFSYGDGDLHDLVDMRLREQTLEPRHITQLEQLAQDTNSQLASRAKALLKHFAKQSK